MPRGPLLCDTGIVIIGQGRKTGYLNDKTFIYDEDHYLISSVPTAYECETQATIDNPLLGLFINIDLSRVHEIMENIEKYTNKYSFKASDLFCGVEPSKMDARMHDVTRRLLSCLQSPLDSQVLGQALIDEIIYTALLGDHGKALAALTKQETHHARIAQSINYINSNYMNKVSVHDLVHHSNMSISSFHRAFKFVTGESPLQYLKKVRLNRARFLITQEGSSVGNAANQMGYESVSQFSREFKRYFNISPGSVKDISYI